VNSTSPRRGGVARTSAPGEEFPVPQTPHPVPLPTGERGRWQHGRAATFPAQRPRVRGYSAARLALALATLLTCACGAAANEALDALVAAYPDFLAGHDGKELLWRDGTRMAVSDGIADKDFATLLDRPDLDDMFAFAYPLGAEVPLPILNHDPGRVRHAPFFARMYGDCRNDEVRARLKPVVWLPRKWGKSVLVTEVNGVAERLEAVSRALDRLPERFDAYLAPPAGTYNCRAIAGTERASAHGWGIALDIATAHADYWRWAKPSANGAIPHRNRIPIEIVEIFEREGFIWGGKWYHYDTMHFEYRPELIRLARARGTGVIQDENQ
jgi:hypothetical protein